MRSGDKPGRAHWGLRGEGSGQSSAHSRLNWCQISFSFVANKRLNQRLQKWSFIGGRPLDPKIEKKGEESGLSLCLSAQDAVSLGLSPLPPDLPASLRPNPRALTLEREPQSATGRVGSGGPQRRVSCREGTER